MQTYLGYFFIFVAAALWSLLGPLGRIAMEEGLAPIDVAFWRAAFGAVFLLLHTGFMQQLYIQRKAHLMLFALFGFFSIASFFVAYQYAVQYGGVALASVLLYTAPAWVAIMSRIFWKERFTLITCVAVGMSLLGVTLISFSSGDSTTHITSASQLPILGVLFGLLAGFLYSTHYIVTKKYLAIYSSFTLYGYSMLFAAVALLPFVTTYSSISFTAWFTLISIGFFSTYMAYVSYCEGVKRLNSTKAAVLATLEPVLATFLAWYIWGESFSAMGWVGALLVICTVLVLLLNANKQPSEELLPASKEEHKRT